jgi:hypothetical protein
VHTSYSIPLFTSIGFRVKPSSPHYMAIATSGQHVHFVNLFPVQNDELIGTFQK